MKRVVSLLLLMLLLTGCEALYPNDYVTVTEHVAPYAHKETTQPPPAPTEAESPMPKASRASDIREIIQTMVKESRETSKILLVHYEGDIENDMKNMVSSMREDSPKYIYAMHPDSFEFSLHRTQAGVVVTVNLKLRLTAQEVLAIDTELFPEPAMTRLYEALDQHLSSYTVQVSGYQDTDFAAKLDEYILHHPAQVVEAPGFSVAVYPPDRGNVRVLEFHFDYNDNTPDILKAQQDDTIDYLNNVQKRLSNLNSAEETVNTLYKHFVPAFGYENDPNTTVYSLVVEKKGGSSRIMASVVEYLCQKAGWNCEIVVGARNGEPWYWNRILVDYRWLYFDLHLAGLTRTPPSLYPAAGMVGYIWDYRRYPEAEHPSEESTSTEATDPEASETSTVFEQTQTETTEAVSTADTEPQTEPSATESAETETTEAPEESAAKHP